MAIEPGKIASEGRGEVQEMIDICDFASVAGTCMSIWASIQISPSAPRRLSAAPVQVPIAQE
ncbi:MAG TPA: hypothetical protein VGJ20_37210 [Xanthobacteraceae bacterium]